MRRRSCVEGWGGGGVLDFRALRERPAPNTWGQWESPLLALLQATRLHCLVPPLGTSKQWGYQPGNHRSLGEGKQWPKSATTFTNPRCPICKEKPKLPQVISPSGKPGGFFMLLGQLFILLSVFVTVDPESHHFFMKALECTKFISCGKWLWVLCKCLPITFLLFQHSVRI